MPKQKVETFQQAIDEVLQELREIMVKKQRDYGKSNILDFGERGVLVRANDKMERLKNLIWNNQVPQNEKVEDSWIDLAGYCVIALMVRNQTFQKPLDESK